MVNEKNEAPQVCDSWNKQVMHLTIAFFTPLTINKAYLAPN